ncbi:MAG: guanylate kinase [Actinomycetota bacterium]|nr:guanylate kinase [Actinomycetota bacterium]
MRKLLERDPTLYFSVSAKTRAPRPGEENGRDYWFMSEQEFDRLVAKGAFLEWASMFGHRSGTLADQVERERAAGHDVILEIDVQGARQIRDRVPDAVLIFLEPPSREELLRRLEHRGTERGEALGRRLAAVEREMAEEPHFDHRVVNDDLERAAAEVAAIIERYRTNPLAEGPRA